MKNKTVLYQKRVCETMSGDLAYTVGRIAFRPGRPMLVEHVGGIYLEHSLCGTVLTAGYGPEYNIVHVWPEEMLPFPLVQPQFDKLKKVFVPGCSLC